LGRKCEFAGLEAAAQLIDTRDQQSAALPTSKHGLCPNVGKADEGAFVFDNRMAGYGAEPTPKRPTDNSCERRFVAARRPCLAANLLSQRRQIYCGLRQINISEWECQPETQIGSSRKRVSCTGRNVTRLATVWEAPPK